MTTPNTPPEPDPLPNPAISPVIDSTAWTGTGPGRAAAATIAAQNKDAATAVPTAKPLPAFDTRPEIWILDDIEEYLKDAKIRFESVLTGMATTTAEMVRHLENAVIHLKDHIDQTKAKAREEGK